MTKIVPHGETDKKLIKKEQTDQKLTKYKRETDQKLTRNWWETAFGRKLLGSFFADQKLKLTKTAFGRKLLGSFESEN